jgi:hypothetical protein
MPICTPLTSNRDLFPITVRARLHSDRRLEGVHRYYRLDKVYKLDKGEYFYVLKRINGAAATVPIFQILDRYPISNSFGK